MKCEKGRRREGEIMEWKIQYGVDETNTEGRTEKIKLSWENRDRRREKGAAKGEKVQMRPQV